MANDRTVLSVRNVTKVIGKKTLVDNVSFDVYEGEVFGFLGPNGAGKTTTIRMLVDLIKPTSGEIEIGGYSVQRQFIKAMEQVGCIVENPEMYSFMTGWENLKQFARMLGNVGDARIEEIVQLVNLEARIHDRVKTYSLGMKQRLGIAQALLNRPRLLILDEPTNGLDPVGIRELRAFVRQLVEQENISVVISSHLLSEVQMMCDRVGIIQHGKMITVDTIEALMNRAMDKIEWRVDDVDAALALLTEQSPDSEFEIHGPNVIVGRMTPDEIPQLSKLLIDRNIQLQGVRPVVVTLEDLFVELTGGEGIA